MKKARINEIWGVLFLLLGLYTLAGLLFFDPRDIPFFTSHPNGTVHNYTGIIGAYTAFGLLFCFGFSAYLIPTFFLLWSGCFFLQQVPEKKFFKFIGLAIALVSSSTILTVLVAPDLRFERGGVVGYLAGSYLARYFGALGSLILAGSCLLLSLLLATDFLLYPFVKKFFAKVRKQSKGFYEFYESVASVWAWVVKQTGGGRSKVGTTPVKKEESRFKPNALPAIPLKVKRYQPGESDSATDKNLERAVSALKAQETKSKEVAAPPKPVREKEPETSSAASSSEPSFEGVVGSPAFAAVGYELPSIELLRRPQKGTAPKDDLQENSRILESTLAEFGIEVKVVEVEQGPVITRYELMPAPGVKVNSISALSDDIALAMKAATVRLIIPIPGKSAVGVEVPNSISSTVSLRELIETQKFRSGLELPLALGKDTSGRPLVGDLTTMPHIMIAGTTGSGKTVCVNSIILGLLYSKTPAELKFIMVDPKMVELSIYNKIPHLLSPVVTDVRKAAHTLNWVVNEMENRYKLFAAVGVRNIQGFNSRPVSEEAAAELAKAESENVVPARLPYIVVVIDELADLMMVARDKVEGAIMRLAQLSRAVGIHLILATQRPSVDVITGVIKANFPARISFKVASRVDSRTVLDGSGADKLIGKGDMLFMQPGDAKPTRGQGAFVVDEEINRVVDFVAKQAKPDFHPEIQSAQSGQAGAAGQEKDELFDEAVAVVLETGQASTSNLQRRLRLGYTRAARIIDQMEAAGVVGPAHGAKPRDILIGRENAQPVPTE